MSVVEITDEPADLVDDLLACSNDPLRFVELAFPNITPERWQRTVMTHIGDQLSANMRLSKFDPIQVAVASGNTIGKRLATSSRVLPCESLPVLPSRKQIHVDADLPRLQRDDAAGA